MFLQLVGVVFLTIFVDSQYHHTAAQIGCGNNEQYSPCTQICPATCESPNPQCRVDCTRPSCNCISGYVYSNSRECIPVNSCYQRQSSRCRFNLDCLPGSYCTNGFCGAASGVYTRTIVTSSSSSSSSSSGRRFHHHHRRPQGMCTLDVHCEHRKICINGACVFSEVSDRYNY